ncbi:MAG: hypothetical protein IKY46_01840 [Clostridia bacterium]|nr:hypothetical protein [Clostridia bacterium]MBR5903704.1 hypothetical protein [Clostridia bacterium]
MKYALSIIAVLLVLLITATAVISSIIMDGKDKVTISAETIYGDESAARGITLDMDTNYRRYLFWHTRYSVDAPETVQTEYTFYDIQQRFEHVDNSHPMEMQDDIKYGFDKSLNWGITKAYNELYAQVKPGEQKEMEITLSDYYDYYPLSVFINLPGSYKGWSSHVLYSSDESLKNDHGRYITPFTEYFRIPVLPESRLIISIGKSISGNSVSTGGGYSGEDHYYITTHSVKTEDAFYFVFDAHTNTDRLVDTSLIKGGFGIYKLPYTHSGKEYEVLVDSLQTVFTLDPYAYIIELEISDDGRLMYLYTIENGIYTLTVIDATTYKQVQKLQIGKVGEREDRYSHYRGDGFITFMLDRFDLYVYTQNPDGTYSFGFKTEIDRNDEEIYYLSKADLFLNCDGERLVVCKLDTNKTDYSTYSLSMMVYTKDGLQYRGRYTPSLMAGGKSNDTVYFSNYDYLTITFE